MSLGDVWVQKSMSESSSLDPIPKRIIIEPPDLRYENPSGKPSV